MFVNPLLKASPSTYDNFDIKMYNNGNSWASYVSILKIVQRKLNKWALRHESILQTRDQVPETIANL